MLYIGSHVSFNKDTQLIGVVETALSNNANTFMFYTGSNQSTLRFPIDKNLTDKAHQIMCENNIEREKCVIHAPFIINLANNSDERKYQFYIDFLKQEIDRCIALGINNLVLHPGSHVSVPKDEALLSVSKGLNEALKEGQNINILIEYMSGKGTEVGSTIDELKTILENVIYKDKVCIILGSEIETSEVNDEGKTGSAHNLCYFPSLADIQEFSKEMSKYIKNITLSSQRACISAYELVDIVEKYNGVLIPAHAFTPHKSFYGNCTSRLERIFKEKFRIRAKCRYRTCRSNIRIRN